MTAAAPSPLYDLLVVLGTQRFGTDWPNVSAAVKAALGPLEARDEGCTEPPSATECEERFRALVEGNPAELSALASRLQTKRLGSLLASRQGLVKRIKVLCQELPPGHAARPAAAFADPPGGDSVAGDEGGNPSGGRGSGGGSGGGRSRSSGVAPTDDATTLEKELDESWPAIAEEEERNPRRATVAGTLNKMLQAVAKHKWAYPFKRPVTDKEAPDYKDIITNPMDFTTLKRRIETAAVTDVSAMVNDLNLIFDNAMVYNGKGTDYYRMAQTLKEIVRVHQGLYTSWRQERAGPDGAALAAPPIEGGDVDAETKPEAEAKAVEGDAADAVPPATAEQPAAGRRGRRGART